MLELVEDGHTQLQQGERVKLATEVVNSVLKGLTEAIKSSSSQASHLKSKAPNPALMQSNDGSVEIIKPLQPRSHNCVIVPSKDGTGTHRPCSALPSSAPFGAAALAECARIAFLTLRRAALLNKAEKTTPSYQIENGMSALIGKLIVLGLDDMASKELRILAKRLRMGDTTPDALPQQKLPTKQMANEINSSKQTLVDLYRVTNIPKDDQRLSLIIATQLHITKLLALKRRRASIEAACIHLELSTSYSPVNLIEKSISADDLSSKNRAARQLEHLAQSILLLCPSQLASTDECSKDTNMFVDPEICLRFQLLALRIRRKSWLLAGHQVDVQRQILTPFNRYIQVFMRTSKIASTIKYKTLKGATGFLGEVVGPDSLLDSLQKQAYDSSCIDLYELLADLALKNGDSGEAVLWSDRSILIMDAIHPSQARRCALLCHAAEIIIQCFFRGSSVEPMTRKLELASSALRGDLQGTSIELDDLLISCASLRRYASLVLNSSKTDGNIAALGSGDQILCFDTILSSLRFVVRYLGKDPGSESGKSSTSRYEQRLRLTERVARPTVEAVISLVKLPLASTPDMWNALDEALQQSVRLVSSLENSSRTSSTIEGDTAHNTLSVQLSNAYWLHYLEEKSNQASVSDLQQLLQKSIKLIEACTLGEKEQGILHVKLEKLGSLYESQSKWRKAATAYSQALDILTGFDEIRRAAEKATMVPLSKVLSEEGMVGTFKRILKAFYIVHSDDTTELLEPLSRQWSVQQYGFVLETQLAILVDLVNTRLESTAIHSTIKRVSESLLQIYTHDEFPLRRLQASIQILRCHRLVPTIISRFALDVIGAEVFDPRLGADQSLKPYNDHWQAQRDSLLALVGQELNLDLLQTALRKWNSMCSYEDTIEGTTLDDKIDDIPTLILHLGSIAECLHTQGLGVQRVATLRLILSILGSRPLATSSQYVTTIAQLGLELVRLGYSSQGGISLQKARKHLDDKILSENSLLQWNISYAEYLIDIGNVAKSEEYTERAKEIFHGMLDTGAATINKISDRYYHACAAADLMRVISATSFARGQMAQALFYAKKAVRLSYRAWALLERRSGSRNHLTVQSSQSDSECLADTLSRVHLSSTTHLPVMSTKHESLKSTSFWPLVPQLFRHLIQLSTLLGHEGMLSEAKYYVDQAAKIAQTVQAGPLRAQIEIVYGEFDVQSGKLEDGIARLNQAKSMIMEDYPRHLSISVHLALAQAYARKGDIESENVLLKSAEGILKESPTVELSTECLHRPGSSTDIVPQMKNLELDVKNSKATSKGKRAPVERQTRGKQATIMASERITSKVESESKHLPLIKSQALLLRQRGSNDSRQDLFEAASDVLAQARVLSTTSSDSLLQSLELACHLLRQGLSGLLTDPVFGVLQDSTTSCPSFTFSGCFGRKEALQPEATDANQKNVAKKTRARIEAKSLAKKQAMQTSSFAEFLSNCFDVLSPLHSSAQKIGSSYTLHRLTDVLSKTLLLLSATCSANPSVPVNPAFTTYAMGESMPVS